MPLLVQDTPTLKLASTELTFKHTETSYNDVLLAIQNNIVDAYDFENNKIDSSNISIDGLNAIFVLSSKKEKSFEQNTHNIDKTEESSADNTHITDKTEELSADNTHIIGKTEESSQNKDTSELDTTKPTTSGTDFTDRNSTSENILNKNVFGENATDDNNTSKEDSSLQDYILLTGDFTITYTIVDKYGLTSSCDAIIHILP